MTMLTPQQIADLKASIAAKYTVLTDPGPSYVADATTWDPINNNEHLDVLDAEAEMEAIIQDEVKAAMEALD